MKLANRSLRTVMAFIVLVAGCLAAMQEAGFIRVTPVDFVAVPMLGVHPNAQGLAAQFAMLALTVAVVLLGRTRTPADPMDARRAAGKAPPPDQAPPAAAACQQNHNEARPTR